jgi:phasin family protein
MLQHSGTRHETGGPIMTTTSKPLAETNAPVTKPLENIATDIAADTAAQAKDSYLGMVKAGQEQMEKASSQLLKGYEELQSYGKDNISALMESGGIVARAAEDLGKEVAAYTQTSFEKSLAASKAMMAAKSLKEMVELQNDYAKSSFDAFIEETGKLRQLSLKLTTEAFAPLSARANAATQTLPRPPAG